jgi:hypothetical protein
MLMTRVKNVIYPKLIFISMAREGERPPSGEYFVLGTSCEGIRCIWKGSGALEIHHVPGGVT